MNPDQELAPIGADFDVAMLLERYFELWARVAPDECRFRQAGEGTPWYEVDTSMGWEFACVPTDQTVSLEAGYRILQLAAARGYQWRLDCTRMSGKRTIPLRWILIDNVRETKGGYSCTVRGECRVYGPDPLEHDVLPRLICYVQSFASQHVPCAGNHCAAQGTCHRYVSSELSGLDHSALLEPGECCCQFLPADNLERLGWRNPDA